MGALTSNRKRGDDYFSVNSKSPGSSSPLFEGRSSKKARLELDLSANLTPDRPHPLKSAISRLLQYPELKTQFKREPHAPVRPSKFGLFGSRNNESRDTCRRSSILEMGNLLSRKYKDTRRDALDSFRYVRNDKEVIEVDKKEEISEDSSVEEVEVLDVHRDLKWKDGNADAEDSKKYDGRDMDLDFRPSSSSAVTNVNNLNSKTEKTEKLLESLSLSKETLSAHKKLLDDAERRNDKLKLLKFQIELKEKERKTQQLLRPQKKPEVEVLNKELVAEAFKPLTKEEEAEVSRAFSNSNRRKVLVTHENSNIDITGEVLQCLKPGAWLNDEVINLYLELIKEREKREPQKFLKCHYFSTFFYNKLISGKGGYNFQSVRRWTSQRKLGYCIFDCDKIFVPIHKEVHWCLAVINKKDESFQYLDSLGGVDAHVLKILARYLMDEVKDKSGKEIDVSSWKQEFVKDLPEQENGFDCGVFMVKYADFYSRDIGLCFKQEHMPYFRKRTAKEILRLKAE